MQEINEKKAESKCLLIFAQKGKSFAINDHIKKLNGFYNGLGWYVESKYSEEVDTLCASIGLKYVEFPMDELGFSGLRRKHRASFYHEKSVKTKLEIEHLVHKLNIAHIDLDDILKNESLKDLWNLPEGRVLEDSLNEYRLLQERLQQVQEDDKIAKLSIENTSHFQYLLNPISEKEIVEEFQNASPGITVGFKLGDIDLKIPGGAISILAGPTSHGKTAVSINFCLGALNKPENEGRSVYFFSYEESRAAILSLFMNTYIGEALSHNNRESIRSYFRQGNVQYISEQKRAFFLHKKNEFFDRLINTGRLNIFYSEMPINELVAAIHFLKKRTNVGLICIDYMQLLSLREGRFGSRQEELKQICLILKNCAIETGLPIILGAQFNRTVIAERDLSPINIREAGDIEQVANLILGFWNRNFDGFSKEGNVSKSGKQIPKEPTIYMEILKGRETGSGAFEVLDFDGNSGKLSQKKSVESLKNLGTIGKAK